MGSSELLVWSWVYVQLFPLHFPQRNISDGVLKMPGQVYHSRAHSQKSVNSPLIDRHLIILECLFDLLLALPSDFL
jgi:hypothetical protein